MSSNADLAQLNPDQLRSFTAELLQRVEVQDRTIRHQRALNEKLTHELAILKRHRFGRSSEVMNPDRTLISHEPDNTQCPCGCQLKRIGEDVSEKLDYTPGEFTVERHVRGKWACASCETLIQAPVPAQVIDKGIPTSGLLAHVLVAKFGDHLPLHRQETIFARAGHAIPRSTLAKWVGRCGVTLQPLVDALREELVTQAILHADETPVPMLAPGKKKTHQAYVWAYASTRFGPLQAVIYEFAPSRAGKHARAFLKDWQGKLVCDDFAGYKAGFEQGMTEIACWAHARRKFYDLHASGKSTLSEHALGYIGQLYEIEAETKALTPTERHAIRQARAAPIIDALYTWMIAQRLPTQRASAISELLPHRWVDPGKV